MNCPGCDRELKRHERAQPAMVFGMPVTVPSFCDECCRASTPTPGSAAALARIDSGEIDKAEFERVRAATPMPWDEPPERTP
jgi:hypothetical protein